MRIVSLLPSATEIICQLGLGEQLVGVTHECDYPPFVKNLPKVTRTLIPHDATSGEIDSLVRDKLKTQLALYSLNRDVLDQLRPDLIVTQALCDVCAVATEEVAAAACSLPGAPRVINLEPSTLSEVFECIQLVGEAAGRSDHAVNVIADLQARVDAVATRTRTLTTRPTVVLLEWIDPPFSSGHWSPEIVRLAGGREAIGREQERSRTITWADIQAVDPDVLVIACCGFDIERTWQDIPILTSSPGFQELSCVGTREVYLVDGNAYFSRPGPRLVESLEVLAHLLHPNFCPVPQHCLPARRLTGDELKLGRRLT